jgi:hypothetical protein
MLVFSTLLCTVAPLPFSLTPPPHFPKNIQLFSDQVQNVQNCYTGTPPQTKMTSKGDNYELVSLNFKVLLLWYGPYLISPELLRL